MEILFLHITSPELTIQTNLTKMAWRWDQGRLEYFEYDTLRKIAGVLVQMEGVDPNEIDADPLRKPLVRNTSQPFAPERYRVWRNYARVFKLGMLATRVDDKLICTELCHRLAADLDFNADDYLAHIVPRFYYPSPVFQGYRADVQQVFPLCAILKLLLGNSLLGRPLLSLSEIPSRITANSCTGTENLRKYRELDSKQNSFGSKDEERQVREMMTFVSQFTFLKWQNPNLLLDANKLNSTLIEKLTQLATPIVSKRDDDPDREILSLGRLPEFLPIVPRTAGRIYNQDAEFIEGKKTRITHLVSERSRKLRELFFNAMRPPFICDMCVLNVSVRYPWSNNILELHHLLPLSSPLRIENATTSIRDLVGICPSCHRATHIFYRLWLDREQIEDFRNYQEARDVYALAKRSVQ